MGEGCRAVGAGERATLKSLDVSAEALGLVGARQPLLLQQTWGQTGAALARGDRCEKLEVVALNCCSAVRL